ncbi:MAG: type II toxin-antitoxin system VapC family toxin [Burkholderiales bacterium]|jgi:predicted nucleic-acid-binding protein|nr:type II toxin-antitoxin system VapC family toxin [Burkholderiales bacterium]
MIGLDTNVLVRFLVQDDTRQFERAQRLIQREAERGEPVMISLLVLLETEWVLRGRYALSKEKIADTISGRLDAAEVRFESEPVVEQALYLWRDSAAEFADCLVGAHHRSLGCEATASCDARAMRLPYFVAP